MHMCACVCVCVCVCVFLPLYPLPPSYPRARLRRAYKTGIVTVFAACPSNKLSALFVSVLPRRY